MESKLFQEKETEFDDRDYGKFAVQGEVGVQICPENDERDIPQTIALGYN